MPTDPRKRQKKREKHAAKRKARQHELSVQKQTGMVQRLTEAAQFPVLHSWVSESLWTEGLGQACLSRELPRSQVAYAVFLVDRYCLGVKDVFFDVVGRSQYEDKIYNRSRRQFEVQDLAPAALRKLIETAVAYAQGIGLHPPADYARARVIFGDIDPAECKEEFEMGKDGQPLFVAGPNDTPERCRRILNTLTSTCGPDGFHFMIPFPLEGMEGGQALDMDDLDVDDLLDEPEDEEDDPDRPLLE
jgi:hypothetical protein